MSPSGKYFVDNYSKPDVPSVSVLRDETGKIVLALEKMDISRLLAAGWKPPMPITVKDRGGVGDLYGLLFRPTNFDPSKKYPIINRIYPGPQTGSVGSRQFSAARSDAQAIAELGFVVVMIDGMGTPWRSKRFHAAYYGNMGDNTLPDQVAGMKELASRYPWIDIDRAGITGHSGGGFATAAAMFRYPDFFKVGVSQAGNHDNRVYEDDWAEKWQGLLQKNPDGTTNYDNQANQLVAHQLKGQAAARARIDGRQRAVLQHAARRRRADQGEQGFRSDHLPESRPRIRQRAVHGAPAVGLLREAPARRRAAAVRIQGATGDAARDPLNSRFLAFRGS